MKGSVPPSSSTVFLICFPAMLATLRPAGSLPVSVAVIIESGSPGRVSLVAARLDGILHFLFRAQPEPGLGSKVELTPTIVVEPGDAADESSTGRWQGKVVAECLQSEEGGRFYRDTNAYRVVDIGIAGDAGPNGYWLTLGDVRLLLDEPGWLTNEARSALSLLLPWM